MTKQPPGVLLANLGELEAALAAALHAGPEPLVQVSRYVMGWQDEAGRPLDQGGGKRIRPALCLFAATLFGEPPSVAMPGAVAVELIHNFSLVHDEVQDHDAERHHRPTVWALMGEGQAINAGDFLITRAFAALLGGRGIPAQRMAALQVLNDAMARMIAGQWADISFEAREDVSTGEYLDMVRGKTGALLGAPLAMGALLAGASASQAAALQEWGETVGLAFQVQDDYLGIWGDPNLTGKSNINDILRKKKTLPIIHGLANAPSDAIREAFSRAEMLPNDVAEVVLALETAGAHTFTRSTGESLVREADVLLESFELPAEAREQLRRVGAYLVDRES